jgi:hypothetical protein
MVDALMGLDGELARPREQIPRIHAHRPPRAGSGFAGPRISPGAPRCLARVRNDNGG